MRLLLNLLLLVLLDFGIIKHDRGEGFGFSLILFSGLPNHFKTNNCVALLSDLIIDVLVLLSEIFYLKQLFIGFLMFIKHELFCVGLRLRYVYLLLRDVGGGGTGKELGGTGKELRVAVVR